MESKCHSCRNLVKIKTTDVIYRYCRIGKSLGFDLDNVIECSHYTAECEEMTKIKCRIHECRYNTQEGVGYCSKDGIVIGRQKTCLSDEPTGFTNKVKK